MLTNPSSNTSPKKEEPKSPNVKSQPWNKFFSWFMRFNEVRTRKFGKTFELEIWFVISVIAAIRGFTGIVLSIVSREVYLSELIVDSLLVFSFALAAISILREKVSRIHPIILISLIVLLGINFIQFGGVLGSTDFNLFGLGVFVVMACNKKTLRYILPIYFLVVAVVLIDGFSINYLQKQFFLETLTGKEDFFFTSLTMVILIIFFKYALVRESKRLLDKKAILREEIVEMKIRETLLEQQMEELKGSTKLTNDEFLRQTNLLLRHNEAITDFADSAKHSVQGTLNELLEEIDQLEERSILKKVIKNSAKELDQVTGTINQQINKYA